MQPVPKLRRILHPKNASVGCAFDLIPYAKNAHDLRLRICAPILKFQYTCNHAILSTPPQRAHLLVWVLGRNTTLKLSALFFKKLPPFLDVARICALLPANALTDSARRSSLAQTLLRGKLITSLGVQATVKLASLASIHSAVDADTSQRCLRAARRAPTIRAARIPLHTPFQVYRTPRRVRSSAWWLAGLGLVDCCHRD